MHGYTQNKDDYLKRLRRIEGQIRGLQRMVEDDKYCIDILTQVAAATKALQSVALGLLEEHLGHCVAGAIAEGGDAATDKGPRSLRRHRSPRQILRGRPPRSAGTRARRAPTGRGHRWPAAISSQVSLLRPTVTGQCQ